ncbi:MAG TPA: hypothetical protein VK928_01705 [Longimicrobiales bacterium]|nr:hypothetical protein [Longimicrobiales bacterium]
MSTREQLHHGSEGNVIRHLKHAVRAAALLLVVAGATACADDPAPLFEIPGTGAIEGQLFLDANRDGRYDPSDGDRLLSNVGVRLLERGTSQTIAGSQTSTDAAGRFRLATVPVGSHDLAIDTTGVGAGVAFCQNPVPVTVFLNESLFQQVAARGGCVISIAEAELLPVGAPVTVQGTITSALGMINATIAFIQDATGGIALFRFIGAPPLQVGDVVELSGTIDVFNQELEIVDVRVASVTPGEAPVPKTLTTKQVADAGPNAQAPDQGRLVRVVAAELMTVFGAGGGRNATIDDGSGSTAVRIETGLSSSTSDINPRFTVGNCYTMTGILRNFNGTAQLTPRTYADIQEVPCL